jgi:hypothetical protein
VFRQGSPDITPVSFEVSLFGDPRIEARLPAPRGLSQVTTSFIGSWCLGIHRSPLVACYYYKDARVHCEVLNIRAETKTPSKPREDPWPAKKAATRTHVPHDRTFRTQQRASGRTLRASRFHSHCWVVLTLLAGYGLMVNVPHSGAYLAEHIRSGTRCMDETKASP